MYIKYLKLLIKSGGLYEKKFGIIIKFIVYNDNNA